MHAALFCMQRGSIPSFGHVTSRSQLSYLNIVTNPALSSSSSFFFVSILLTVILKLGA